MLRCLFGKCSSDTYVVNQLPKPQTEQKVVSNGVSKINSLPNDPTSSVIEQPHDRNNENNAIEQVPQIEKTNNQNNELIKKDAPSPPQISPKRKQLNKNTEIVENNSLVLENASQRENLINRNVEDISVTHISSQKDVAGENNEILTSEEHYEPLKPLQKKVDFLENQKQAEETIDKKELYNIGEITVIITQPESSTPVSTISTSASTTGNEDKILSPKVKERQNPVQTEKEPISTEQIETEAIYMDDTFRHTENEEKESVNIKKIEEKNVSVQMPTKDKKQEESIEVNIVQHESKPAVDKLRTETKVDSTKQEQGTKVNMEQDKSKPTKIAAVDNLKTETKEVSTNQEENTKDNMEQHESKPTKIAAVDNLKTETTEVSTKQEENTKVNMEQHESKPTAVGNLKAETKGVATKQEQSTKVNKEQYESKPMEKEPIDKLKTESKDQGSSKVKSAESKKKGKVKIEPNENGIAVEKKSSKKEKPEENGEVDTPVRRRSGVVPLPVKYDENVNSALPNYPKAPDDEELIKSAIERNDFLNKIISGNRLEDVIHSMYNKEIASKETIIKQGEKGSHMYISAKGKYQVVVKGKVVSDFDDVRVFGELAILYNAKRLATIKALTPGRVWVLDRSVYQQIMLRYNIKERDEIMEFLMNNKKLNVVGKDALQEVASLLKSEFFPPGKQIVRQGDKGHQFYIIRAGTVTISKDGEGVVGQLKKGDCFGELALLKEDCRQATVTANASGVECLTLTRKEFIDHFGELDNLTDIKARPQDSIKDAIAEHEDINLNDLKIIKTLGVGGFGRVELVQHTKKKDLVFALKYLKKIDIVLQHQQEHAYNEKNIQMACKTPFIVRLYRTYKDSKYIYLLMESCLGGDLWSLLQKQKLRRFEEKEARFIAGCVLEAFDYLHARGIIYRDLKPENLLIASNGYIKLTDFGFAKKISSRGRTFTFAGTPEYVAPEIVLNRGHDRAVDYWAFGAFIFELLTGRTPFRTDDSSHMKTYNKILNGIDNIQFPSYVNLKARHIVEKLCRPVPTERLGMQRGGIKDIKAHKWFLGFDWQKFAKCEMPSPFKPKLKSQIDTQYFDQFKKDTDIPPDEISGWDVKF